jgi:hypothetical protein
MTFKPAIWTPIAVVLSAVNLVAVGFAARAPDEPWHAAAHAALALAFGLWAQRLRQKPRGNELPAPNEVLEALEGVEADVSQLRQEMNEMQERLDFTERVLAKGPESGRMGPQR